jgi:hypothetical protein
MDKDRTLVKVTRTIVITGQKWWVDITCSPEKTLVHPDKPFVAGANIGRIEETERIEERLDG